LWCRCVRRREAGHCVDLKKIAEMTAIEETPTRLRWCAVFGNGTAEHRDSEKSGRRAGGRQYDRPKQCRRASGRQYVQRLAGRRQRGRRWSRPAPSSRCKGRTAVASEGEDVPAGPGAPISNPAEILVNFCCRSDQKGRATLICADPGPKWTSQGSASGQPKLKDGVCTPPESASARLAPTVCWFGLRRRR